VLEMRTDNFAQPRKVSFQEIDADGNTVGTKVMVNDAEFSYSLPEGWKAYRKGQQQSPSEATVALRQQITAFDPAFFGRGTGFPRRRQLADAWPLPCDRTLFSAIELDHAEPDEYTVVGLYVLDRVRQRVKSSWSVAAVDGRAVATARAAEWMQGLRAEDLSEYDTDMIEWLGEIAYRMTPDQLTEFSKQYFAIPSDAWGTHDNPDLSPVDRLGEVLSSMGFSDDYLGMHW